MEDALLMCKYHELNDMINDDLLTCMYHELNDKR